MLIHSPDSDTTTGWILLTQIFTTLSAILYFLRLNSYFDHLQALGSCPSTANFQNKQTKAFQTKYIQKGARVITFKFMFQNGRIKRKFCKAGAKTISYTMLFLILHSHFYAVLSEPFVSRIIFPAKSAALAKPLSTYHNHKKPWLSLFPSSIWALCWF